MVFSYEIDTQNALQTTDAVPTTILTAQMPPSSSATLFIMVVARKPATGDTKCWMLAQPRKRTGSGPATLVGTAGDMLPSAADAGTAAWTLSLLEVGDTLNMQVTGVAATTIDWYARAQGMVVT